jgi:hypothetical protein
MDMIDNELTHIERFGEFERYLTTTPDEMASAYLRHRLSAQFVEDLPFNPYLRRLADRGRFFSIEGLTLVKGRKLQCHRNVARLFAAGKIDIATGYAEYLPALWYCHSWGLSEGKMIIETTIKFNQYFGIALSKAEARRFTQLNG